MNMTRSLKYYVFGAGSSNAQISYIGWSVKSPDENKQGIFCELAENKSAALKEWISEVWGLAEKDIFEIETFSSADEAEEAVIFWRSYFGFLGWSLIGVSGDRPEALGPAVL